MNNYEIKYNKFFEKDIQDAYVYISNILCSPMSARRFIEDLNKCILNIQTMPEAYKIKYSDNKLDSVIRQASFNNYVILYKFEDYTIELFRLLYSKRNISKILEKE